MAKKRGPSIGTLDVLVGRNIRAGRDARELSQAAFGDAEVGVGVYLGVTWPKQVVSKIERGLRSLDASELVAAARVLEVPVTHLLTGTAEPSNAEVDLGGWVLTITELREAVMSAQEAALVAEAQLARIEQRIEAATKLRTEMTLEVRRAKRASSVKKGKGR